MKFRMRIFVLLAVTIIVLCAYMTIIRPDVNEASENVNNDYIDNLDANKDEWDLRPDPKWMKAIHTDYNSKRASTSSSKPGRPRPRRLTVSERVNKYIDMNRPLWSYTFNGSTPWSIAAKWVTSRQTVGVNVAELVLHDNFHKLISEVGVIGFVLSAMAKSHVTSADVGYRGTQLKMTLVLDGQQQVIFKPRWYARDYVVEGKPYEGHDRHNAEIMAFHLSRVLGMRRVPLTVGRVIDLELDVLPVATERLRNTFFTNGSDTCFYGKCLYCKSQANGVCANKTQLEGAVVLWLPKHLQFQQYRHPWGRTYRDGRAASVAFVGQMNVVNRWEYDAEHYCSDIRRTPLYESGPLLLDIIDTCVFDFIIGNADRHHYEVFDNDSQSILIMFDNGKSFGNAAVDEMSILAPLTQCKQIRESTLERLYELTDGALSRIMRQITADDPIAPLLAEPHFKALDRRLAIVLHTVDDFIRQSSLEAVLVSDGFS